MIDEFAARHNNNISKINGILASIDDYLVIMKRVWDYRIESNRSLAIMEWKRLFVNCRENLINSFEGTLLNITVLYMKRSLIDGSYRNIVDDLKGLLGLTSNASINEQGYNRLVLRQSNDSLINLMQEKLNNEREDIDRLFTNAFNCYKDYNHWLTELENTKTANFKEMGLLEQILFKENNELGRKLTIFVLERKFEGISFSEYQSLLDYKK
jgi:hypothetical protein